MLVPLIILAASDAAGCFEAARALPAGAVVTVENAVPVPCDGNRTAAILRYDRSARAALLVAGLPAGGYLGRLANLPSGTVAKGDRLTLRSAAGPIVVEREVTALQAGRSGERIFVRDAGGAVFAAALILSPGGAE